MNNFPPGPLQPWTSTNGHNYEPPGRGGNTNHVQHSASKPIRHVLLLGGGGKPKQSTNPEINSSQCTHDSNNNNLPPGTPASGYGTPLQKNESIKSASTEHIKEFGNYLQRKETIDAPSPVTSHSGGARIINPEGGPPRQLFPRAQGAHDQGQNPSFHNNTNNNNSFSMGIVAKTNGSSNFNNVGLTGKNLGVDSCRQFANANQSNPMPTADIRECLSAQQPIHGRWQCPGVVSNPQQILGQTNHTFFAPQMFRECRDAIGAMLGSNYARSAFGVGHNQVTYYHAAKNYAYLQQQNSPLIPSMRIFQPWMHSTPQMSIGAASHPVPPAGSGHFLPSYGQGIPAQQSTFFPQHVIREYCGRNLHPAPIPYNPLDDNWNNSTPLEKEVAWLLEESNAVLPSSTNGATSQAMPANPLLLDFSWKHGSLQLRERMYQMFPDKVIAIVKKLNTNSMIGQNSNFSRVTGSKMITARKEIQTNQGSQIESALTTEEIVDGYDLLWPRFGSQRDRGNENFVWLRREARGALRLGYRRSESIEKLFNVLQGLRWREAVEEVGEGGGIQSYKPKQSRHQRKKRIQNEDLLRKAFQQGGSLKSTSQRTAEIDDLARQVPSELTPLEDEVAWLVEESLILLPDGMINSKKSQPTESIMSAGLVTESTDINWDYVLENASEALKAEFDRKGGIKRRPLQRIIRYYDRSVRCSFQKRRDDIAILLLLRGYRRNETKQSLPSDEILKQTGLNKVWAVRLMRRRQNETSHDTVSAKELRAACNARMGDKERSPKRARTNEKHGPSVETNRAEHSILTAEEEEIAWLREEFELETGIKVYDWEYIEQSSSLQLLICLAERGCAPSSFQSVPGVSRLGAMVRLHDPRVREAYEQKRFDIRHALTRLRFRRDRSRPVSSFDIPSAPPFSGNKRRNGRSVLEVEHAGRGEHNEHVSIDNKREEEKLSNNQSKTNSDPDNSGTPVVNKEKSDTQTSNIGSFELKLSDRNHSTSNDGAKDKENTAVHASEGDRNNGQEDDSSDGASISTEESADVAKDGGDDDEYELSSDADSEDMNIDVMSD